MSDKAIIRVTELVKTYKIYDKHVDRLKEVLSYNKKKYHKKFNALNGISFEVFKGDAIGILGKNGSGKSTLLKIIVGLVKETSGQLEVNGKISAILELGAGFNPEYTGLENIYLNGTMMGYTKEQMKDKISNIIEFADIGDFINQPVKIYSSGMFARLAFAVAINVEPDILIVDEALAVGDIKFQIKCINKMKELKESGTTILFVSHSTDQVKRFCNKAIWIKDGIIQANGEASEIVDIYEDYMKNDVIYNEKKAEESAITKTNEIEEDFVVPKNKDIIASITKVNINEEQFKTFDKLIVEVEYEIYQEKIDGFLLGVAIYTPKRQYIFGPNTYLEKIRVPDNFGRHKIKYIIKELPLLGGTYDIDVGIFTNEGLNCIDYKTSVKNFTIVNKYFSEGTFYIKHEWEVIK